MILETLLTNLFHVSQFLVWSLVQGDGPLQKRKTFSHLCVKSYRVPHPLHMHFFGVEPSRLVITL